MMFKLFAATSTFLENDTRAIRDLRKNNIKVIKNPFKRKLDNDELIHLIKDKDIVVAGLENYTKEVVDSAKKLKLIIRLGSGIDNLDINYIRKKKIKLIVLDKFPSFGVVELTISAMMYFSRGIHNFNFQTKKYEWRKIFSEGLLTKRILIIGFGKIGKAISKICLQLGMKVSIYDTKANIKVQKDIEVINKLVSLRNFDYLSINASAKSEIINKKLLSTISKNLVIMNPSRGHTIDEDYLINLVSADKLRGLWLDVYSEEPYYGPLSKLKSGKILLTPHISTYTTTLRKKMEYEAITHSVNFFKKRSL